MRQHDNGRRSNNRSNKRKRKVAQDKMLKKAMKGGIPIDTGKVKSYTYEEACAAREEREMQQERDEAEHQKKIDNLTPEEKEAIKGAQMRYDAALEQMEPFAEKLSQEKDDLICQAIYHIVGDRLDITKEMIGKMFGWITVKRNPETMVLDVTKDYRVFAFFGDKDEEVFKGQLAQPDPKMLVWHKYEEPIVVYDKKDDKKIVDFINDWVLLIIAAPYEPLAPDLDKNN